MTHGSEKRARTTHMTVRLTDDERATIASDADRSGLMLGSYVRLTLLGAPTPRQIRRPPIERRELARLLGELGHVGANLNQLAHHANTGMPVERGDIERALASLSEMRDAVLSALGRPK